MYPSTAGKNTCAGTTRFARSRTVLQKSTTMENAGAKRVPKYKEWLKHVEGFTQSWGENLLPPDIKHAVNDVENGIGVEMTVWADPPERYLRTADIILIGASLAL